MESFRDPGDPLDRGKQRLLWWSLLGALAGLVPTVYAAAISNSVVLLTDLLRCSAEFIAILFSWVIVRKIARADQVTYNYGFGKLEHLATVAVSGALIVTFLISLLAAVRRFIAPEPVENAEFGLALALVSIAGNAFLWVKNYLYARRFPSPLIDSQWRLFRAKTFATAVVGFSVGATLLFGSNGWPVYVDPIGSLVLAAFMLYSALVMLSSAVPVLVDRAVEEEIQMIIISALVEHEGDYISLERVRTRRTGKRIHIDIFLTFDGDEPFAKIHGSVMRIRANLRGRLPDADMIVVPSMAERSERPPPDR